MIVKKPKKWQEVADTASISFGPIQLFCYLDPNGNGYRFKVGSLVSKKHYTTLDGAKNSGLRYLEKLGKTILDGVRTIPGYELPVKQPEQEKKLDDWHISILGLGRGEKK